MYNITHKDYTFVESETVDFYGVKLNGEFDGVILVYGKVGIKEDTTLDIATLSFTYTIKDPSDHDHDELCADEYFNNYIGAVLEHIINYISKFKNFVLSNLCVPPELARLNDFSKLLSSTSNSFSISFI